MATYIFRDTGRFRYFLLDLWGESSIEVSETEFFEVVGYDRNVVPMCYHSGDINRQDFFCDGVLIGYRTR